MSRYAIFVDAGYLLSQAIKIISRKSSKKRSDLVLVDAVGLLSFLRTKAEELLENKSILRTYWYDGVAGNLTSEHKKILALENVQLRTGTINKSGQQKGVDSKIVTDLVELASNHAICDAIVISGDADLVVGMELAMHRGVRVGVLGLEDELLPVPHNQSIEILQLADRTGKIDGSEIAGFFCLKSPNHTPTIAPGPVGGAVPAFGIAVQAPGLQNQLAIDTAVKGFIDANPALTKTTALGVTGIIYDVDKKLLFHVMTQLSKGALSEDEKRYMRDTFRQNIKNS